MMQAVLVLFKIGVSLLQIAKTLPLGVSFAFGAAWVLLEVRMTALRGAAPEAQKVPS